MIGHPAAGHVNPTLPVIAELVRRGERVYYYATPPFREKIEQTGALFRSLGEHVLFERNLAYGGMLGGMAGLIKTTEQIFQELLRQVQNDSATHLLVEAHALWGNLLAQVMGIPTVTLCSMFAINEELISVRALAGHLYASAEAAREGLQALNEYFGVARHFDQQYGTRCPGVIGYLGNPQPTNIVFTTREFQVGGESFNDSYKFVGPTSGIRMDGSVPTQQFDLSMLNGPVLFIAMGTMYNEEIELYNACFAAFADSPYQVVMAVGHRVDLSALGVPPANFIVRSYIPQLDVLARAALFLTHGGINSAHEAMLHGVPMLALPAAADHFVVAGQVEAVGAGILLPRGMATAETLRTSAQRVLDDPTYRENSTKMGKALKKAGGASYAADEIMNFIQPESSARKAGHVRV
jgi:MGT family glycosyltransferase